MAESLGTKRAMGNASSDGKIHSDVDVERTRAVTTAVVEIRRIEQFAGITRDALEQIRAVLLELVARTELFPEHAFPALTDERGLFPLYRLSEDKDHRFAMYINSSIGNNDVQPHDHTTWAVTVSIQGTEENRFYNRVGDRSSPNEGKLEFARAETVRPGVGVCMMPDDVHSVHARNDDAALILHMYGMALDHLPNRTNFDLVSGTYRRAIPTLHIVDV